MRRSLLYVALSFLIACPNISAPHLDTISNRNHSAADYTLLTPTSVGGSAGLSLVPLATRVDQGFLALTIGSSVLFGTAGFFVGGLAGSALTGDCGYFDCLEGVILGVLIGTPVGTAVGAHIGNGRRGSLGSDLLGGFAGSAVGTLILAVNSDSAIPALLAAASIVALPVVVERKTAAHNARARRVAVTVAPIPEGFHVGNA